jgi:ribosomal protein S12 methylthiotransferase
MKSFYIHRLGCPKNDVDADYLAGYLMNRGLSSANSPEEADLLIVNTCGFILPAKEESIEAIFEMTKLKQLDPDRKLIITGCLSQRYASALTDNMLEVDGVFGISGYKEIGDFIANPRNRITAPSKLTTAYQEYISKRIVQKLVPYAYIKISDGCDNHCSYCAIPLIRGRYRSRRIEIIIDEAQRLLDSGKKELILVSQESTRYGQDIYGQARLLRLLEALTSLQYDFWLRIMYLHPLRVTEELVDYIIDNPKICSYFDIPLQHISNRILKRMNRQIGRKQIEKVLNHIKDRDDKAAIRTTFIVGFPGETENDFDELYRFVDERRFERMGVFEYSSEENTPAESYADQIEGEVKNRRIDDLMLLQQRLAFERNENAVGATLEVMIDAADKRKCMATGRSRYDAPDIDQTVKVNDSRDNVGDVIPVIITGSNGYDLLGRRGIS